MASLKPWMMKKETKHRQRGSDIIEHAMFEPKVFDMFRIFDLCAWIEGLQHSFVTKSTLISEFLEVLA